MARPPSLLGQPELRTGPYAPKRAYPARRASQNRFGNPQPVAHPKEIDSAGIPRHDHKCPISAAIAEKPTAAKTKKTKIPRTVSIRYAMPDPRPCDRVHATIVRLSGLGLAAKTKNATAKASNTFASNAVAQRRPQWPNSTANARGAKRPEACPQACGISA
jgi:hypothetical protein